MTQRLFVLLLPLLLAIPSLARAADRPNIVYILCDDLGYGDVVAFNSECKIATPHMNQLAKEGMIFTDMHSGSAVCTPTRYGVLTGRYAWRSKLQRSVLGGLSPRLIEQGRMTVASFLKQHGYHTTCVGKWHLGMDWTVKPGKQVSPLSIEPRGQVFNVDYLQPIKNGPTSVGFDEYFGISASLDMVPYVFIKNDRVTEAPTEDKAFAMMHGRGGRTTRKGPTAPSFDAADVLPELTKYAVATIGRRAKAAKEGEPFFIYLPYASPHTPILPTKEWQGKSGLNPYADFVMQNDWEIGQVVEAIDKAGLKDNTLIIVTSDNGCSPQAKFDELAKHGHHPSAKLRGHKADIYDGGHRVPFIARWPAKVKAGTSSNRILCLTDLLATCADILGTKLPPNAGEDSVSILPALEGRSDTDLHEAVVHHSINGSFAIRQGKWKLELCPGSGGWSSPRPGRGQTKGLPPVQLYDLSQDIGEKQNLHEQHPEVVQRLTQLLKKYVADGRSTPGPKQSNAVPVEIRKSK